MNKARPSSPATLSWLWPLFTFIAALPLLSHWVRAVAYDPDPLPGAPVAAMGGGTCSVSGPGSCATGNCPKPPLWEVETVTATAGKSGYTEFSDPSFLPSHITLVTTNGTNCYVMTGPPVFYLTSQAKHSRAIFQFIAYASGYTGLVGGGGYRADESTLNNSGNYLATHNWDPTNGVENSVHSGNYSETSQGNLIEHWYVINDPPYTTNVPPHSWTNDPFVTTITNAGTGQWDCWEGVYGDPFWSPGISDVTYTITHTSHLTTYVTNPVYNAEGTYSYGPYPPDPYEDDPAYYYATNHLSGTNHYWLTNEFTDARAMEIALGKLEPFGSNWVTNASMIAELKMQDYPRLTNDYLLPPMSWTPAVALASKFRVRVTLETKTNTSYKIGWTENYQSAIGASYSLSKTLTVMGTGAEMTVAIGEFVPTLATTSIEVIPDPVEDLTPTVPGSGVEETGSLRLRLGLGSAGPIRGAGELRVHEARPSPALATPAVLQFIGLTNDVEVITDGSNWIRQARAPQTLADVVTLTNLAYEVRFYAATNAGTLTNGLYVPTGSPFVVWGISGFATNTNLFRITETRGAGTVTNDFEWAETNQSWTLTTGNGLRREVRSEVWSQTNTLQTITRTLLRPEDNALLARSVQTHYRFPFGLKLTSSTTGEESSPRTTTYAYYTNATEDGASYGKLKTVVTPDGAWQWHEYDGGGHLAKTFSTFGNQGPTNNAALCRVTEFSYSPVGDGDDGTVQGWLPRTTVEKLLDTEIGRSYAVYKTNETSQIKCQTAGATWNASDSLATTTCTYTNGSFKGWTKSERRPDGTMSLHEYEVDGATNLTTVVWSGQPNGAGTAVTNGTKLVTLQGPLGNVISRTTVDIASDIITGSETFSDFDEFGRPGRVTYLDSTFKLFTYICCGVESETDRDGVTTTYAYDALKRRIGSYRNGIWHLNTLDAAGRTLFTQRQGTNASTITQASMVYDIAGRVLYQTNAVGNVTSFGESIDGSGQTVKISTNALGATRIETYFKDGSTKSITGTGTHGVRYEYGIESDLPYTKEIKLLTNGTDSGEWTKTFTDIAGRAFKTVYPDSAYTQSYYNNAGQLWKQRDADGVVTLHAYNAEGQMEYTALDMDRNDTIDFAGIDRITHTVRDVVAAHSTNVRRTRSYAWTENSSTNSLLTSTVESAVDGTRTWQTAFGLTSQSVSLCGGSCAATNIAPDGSYTTTLKTDGYLTSVTRYDSQGTQLGATTFTYDEHGRQKTVTDARNGTTTFIYDDADRRVSVTTPIPASGQSSQTTTTYYDDLGRVWKTVQPDGTSVTNEYHLTMEPKKTYGSRVYPEERGYDYSGRMKTLKTWQNFSTDTGAAVTTWNYHTNRGWLTSKQYADSQGPSYSYSAAGRLTSRTWARGVVTTNTYDYAGQLATVDYSDSTPDVGFFYDRRGRQTGATNANDAITYLHNDAGQLVAEVHGAGVLDGLVVTNTYDHLLRRTNLSTLSPLSAILSSTAYGYDNASRLGTVSDGTNSAHYGYLANSALVESIAFKQSGTTRMTTTKSYDYVNRLTGISSTSAAAAVSFAYAYNSANQRTRVDEADGSYWLYEYDNLGQVTSAKRYASGGYIMPGQQHEYTYDDIGNRKTAKSGGNQFGTNLRESTYGVNALNQYTNRTVPGYIEVQGSAASNATVTVNNESTTRQGAYYRKELTVNNSPAAVWQSITNVAVLNGAGTNGTDIVTTKTGNALVPKTPEAFTYDADGNQTSDGRFTYTWDAENRLLQVESLTNAPTGAKVKVTWTYDASSRRIQQQSYTEQSGTLVLTSNLKFLADGWRHIAELNATNNTPLKTYAWGLDLSGSLDGAGGVGGLLFFRDASTHFYAYDGNGNVRALFSANDGTFTAQYDYDAFGSILRATGSAALANPFRFSTKRTDDLTSLVLYEYRAYVPWLGRWPNRDPLMEQGGMNLTSFVRNAPANLFDSDGRATWGPPFLPPPPPPPPPPGPGSGTSPKYTWPTYICTSKCKSQSSRLWPIPGVTTLPKGTTTPTLPVGPGSSDYIITATPTSPPAAIGGGGANGCYMLIVKCPSFVATFHFTVGDNPGAALGKFTWPSGCSAIMCGGDPTEKQSDCLGTDLKSAAGAAGLSVVGVSAATGCGVDASGNWIQWFF